MLQTIDFFEARQAALEASNNAASDSEVHHSLIQLAKYMEAAGASLWEARNHFGKIETRMTGNSKLDYSTYFHTFAGDNVLSSDEEILSRLNNNSYNSEVENVSCQIKHTPESEIDQSSLSAFLQNSKKSTEIDSKIASVVEGKLKRDINKSNFNHLILGFNRLGINNIESLQNEINNREQEIIDFTVSFFHEAFFGKGGKISRGLSVTYLCFLLLIEKYPDATTLTETLISIGMSPKIIRKSVVPLLAAYHQLKNKKT